MSTPMARWMMVFAFITTSSKAGAVWVSRFLKQVLVYLD
jgi:hypothetical protein